MAETEQRKAAEELNEIREGLKKLSISAMALRGKLAPKHPDEMEMLKGALRSIKGNVEIAIREGKKDADLLPWIIQRIEGVMPE